MYMKSDPITAAYLLNNIVYGCCQYCSDGYRVNKDGKIRKHSKCPTDYPYCTLVDDGDNGSWVRLDDLAQIAMAG